MPSAAAAPCVSSYAWTARTYQGKLLRRPFVRSFMSLKNAKWNECFFYGLRNCATGLQGVINR